MSFVKRAPDLTLWNIHARGRSAMPHRNSLAMKCWLERIDDRTVQLAEQIDEVFALRRLGDDFHVVAVYGDAGIVQVACPDHEIGHRLGRLKAAEGAVYALSPHLMGKA